MTSEKGDWTVTAPGYNIEEDESQGTTETEPINNVSSSRAKPLRKEDGPKDSAKAGSTSDTVSTEHQEVSNGEKDTESNPINTSALQLKKKKNLAPVVLKLAPLVEELCQTVANLEMKVAALEAGQKKIDFEEKLSRRMEGVVRRRAEKIADNLEETETKLIANLLERHKTIEENLQVSPTKIKSLNVSMSINDEENGLLPERNLSQDGDMVTRYLSRDTFNFLIIARVCSPPFFLSLTVFFFQMLTYGLIVYDITNVGQDNPFNFLSNVTISVRIAQLVAIFVAVITQNGVMQSFELIGCKYIHNKSLQVDFLETRYSKFCFSVFLRFLEGCSALFTIFLLVVSSQSVVELLLNFMAVEFVSKFAGVFFILSRIGFLGQSCELGALSILSTSYAVPCKRFGRCWQKIYLIAFLAILLVGWGIIFRGQAQGKFLCHTVMVQFGDDMADLGTFSGLYDKSNKKLKAFSTKQRVEYIERRSELAKIAYCDDIKAWTLSWQESKDEVIDPCKWKARSATTEAYDLLETGYSPWYFQDDYQRVILLDPFYLSCYDCSDQKCNGRGTCSNAVCNCEENWFGLRCEFASPCPTLTTDARFDKPFPGTPPWPDKFELLNNTENGPVESYNRPVYVGHTQPDYGDKILFFTGRRWAATSIGNFDGLQLNSSMDEREKNTALIQYFQGAFHGRWSSFSVEFLTQPMDIGSPWEATSPVGLRWFYAEPKATRDSSSGIQSEDRALRIDTILLCSKCDDISNPCRDGSRCDSAGVCQCSNSSIGALCEALNNVTGQG